MCGYGYAYTNGYESRKEASVRYTPWGYAKRGQAMHGNVVINVIEEGILFLCPGLSFFVARDDAEGCLG